MEMERVMSNEVDLVEHEFLVTKLKSMINTLEADSRKHKFLQSTGLLKRLNDLKQALTSNNGGHNILNKDSLYRIKNVLIEWDLSSNKFSLFSNYSRYLFISKIATLKNELILRATQNNNLNIPQNPIPIAATDRPSWIPELSTRFSDSNAHGIDHKIGSMVRLLSLRRENNGEEFRAVGIYGITGVGKTMLCQQVFKHQNVQSYFLPRIWVCLSKKTTEGVDNQEDHRKVVVKRMLEALGVEEEVIKFAEKEQDLKGLLYVLRLQLVGKNYIIVFDDAWKEDQNDFFSGLDKDEDLCEKLAYGLPKGHGGAVVVTSRWQEMANFMVGRDRTQCLTSTLDSESCWLIFKEEAEKGEGDLCVLSEDLNALKDEIIKKCNGLPLACKLLGQFARESFKEEMEAQQSIVPHLIDNNGIQL